MEWSKCRQNRIALLQFLASVTLHQSGICDANTSSPYNQTLWRRRLCFRRILINIIHIDRYINAGLHLSIPCYTIYCLRPAPLAALPPTVQHPSKVATVPKRMHNPPSLPPFRKLPQPQVLQMLNHRFCIFCTNDLIIGPGKSKIAPLPGDDSRARIPGGLWPHRAGKRAL